MRVISLKVRDALSSLLPLSFTAPPFGIFFSSDPPPPPLPPKDPSSNQLSDGLFILFPDLQIKEQCSALQIVYWGFFDFFILAKKWKLKAVKLVNPSSASGTFLSCSSDLDVSKVLILSSSHLRWFVDSISKLLQGSINRFF